jgi:hypothetical protein
MGHRLFPDSQRISTRAPDSRSQNFKNYPIEILTVVLMGVHPKCDLIEKVKPPALPFPADTR